MKSTVSVSSLSPKYYTTQHSARTQMVLSCDNFVSVVLVTFGLFVNVLVSVVFCLCLCFLCVHFMSFCGQFMSLCAHFCVAVFMF